MYWTLELASKLEDAPWPATKDELIDYAMRSGAPLEVIENLQEMEDEGEIYESIVTGVVRQQETESGTEVRVAVIRTAGGNIRWLLYHSCGRFSDLVIIEVDLRTGKEVAFPQTE